MSKKRVPSRVYAIVDPESGEILEWLVTRKTARDERRAYNRLEGYDSRCTIVEYERKRTA